MVLGELEDKRTTFKFIDELCCGNKIKLSKPIKEKILELIGPPIPYFIQVLFSEICKKYGRIKKNITSKDVEIIYYSEVLGSVCKTYFQHYYNRLKYYNLLNERRAKNILKELALKDKVKKEELYQLFLQKGKEETSIDSFNNLMGDLENDFYIKYDYENNSYIFFSKILKDWWKRYYSL
jgi:hypothetical protein